MKKIDNYETNYLILRLVSLLDYSIPHNRDAINRLNAITLHRYLAYDRERFNEGPTN